MPANERSGYVPEDVGYPFMGLNSLDPPSLLQPSDSPDLSNMIIDDGRMRTRTGYAAIGSADMLDLDAGTVTDSVMATFEFQTLGGVDRAVTVTTSRTYYRDFAGDTWVDITPRGIAKSITAVSTGSNYFEIDGDHTAEFAVGVKFFVRGSTGNDGTYEVTAVAISSGDTRITVASVTDATVDGVIESDEPFTGDTSNVVDYVIGTETSGRYVIMTNGLDGVYWWNGSWPSFRRMPINDTLSGFSYCTSLAIFNSRLVIGNIADSTSNPLTISWSAVADFDDFSLAAGGGSLLLADAQGEIERMLPLADRLVIYATKTIGSLIPAGSDIGFGYETLARDLNLLSPRSVINLGPFHMYQTQENIYLFDGTPQVRPLGDKVKSDISQNLSIEYAYKAHAFYDTPNELAFWFVPTGDSTYKTYVMELNTFDPESSIKWAPYNFSDEITAIGFIKRNDSIKWNTTLPGISTWQDGVGPWNSPSSKKNFPIRILGGAGVVYVFDDTVGDDAGTDIVSYYRGPQFTVPGYYKTYFGRWLKVFLELRGSGSVVVSTSSDEGISYDVQETVVLSSLWARYEVNIDVTSRTLGLELEAEGGYFELKWYRLYVVSGGD